MTTKGIIQTTDYERMQQLDRAAVKAPVYATALRLTAEMVAERVADAAAFHYVLGVVGNIVTGSKNWVAFKKLLFMGPDNGEVLPFPQAIDFGTVPAVAVRAGISGRFSRFAAHCKIQPGYTPNIGIDLGIVSAGKPEIDLDTVQPVIRLVRRPEGVFIDWSWDGLAGVVDTIELAVDRSDGKGDVFLAIDSTPGNLDTFPVPAALARWTYKAIWRVGEVQVGLWSNPVSTVVGG